MIEEQQTRFEYRTPRHTTQQLVNLIDGRKPTYGKIIGGQDTRPYEAEISEGVRISFNPTMFPTSDGLYILTGDRKEAERVLKLLSTYTKLNRNDFIEISFPTE